MSARLSDSTVPSRVWLTSGGENSRRGLFAGEMALKLRPLRRLRAHGAVQASVVFDAEDTAYVADMAGQIQAFDRKGKRRWRVGVTGGVSATPVLHALADRLYVGTQAGWVYAFAASGGKEVWRRQVPTASDPRILSDLLLLPKQNAVVLSSWGGRFRALDAASGEERRSWEAGFSPYAGASADGGETIYTLRAVRGQCAQFVRVSKDGTEVVLHEEPEKGREARRSLVAASPVLDEANGVAYFVANLGRESLLLAYGLKQQAVQWTQRLPCAIGATPALGQDGVLHVAGLDGTVRGLRADGSLLYRYVTGCEYLLAGPVCEAGGFVYVGDPLGVVHRLSSQGVGKRVYEAPRSLQARFSFDSQGRLYVPCTDRTVYVFAG